MTDPMPDRRSVCRTLTDVLQRSVLADRIDPKGFYMLLNSNYAVLQRPGGIDLSPVWAPLVSQVGEDEPALAGLFLGFVEAASQLHLDAAMPAAVSRLESMQRMEAIHRAFGTTAEEAVVEVIPVADLEFDTDEIPSLGSQDLLPILTDELKREITREVVSCLKASAAGPRIDGGKLAFVIDERFSELCDGRSFDFGPILAGLREIPDFTDRQVYVGLARMHERLAGHGIELELPELDVPEAERPQLVEEAREAERRERAERRRASSAPRAPTNPPPKTTSSPTLDVPPPGRTKREQRLRRYGLLGLSSKRWRAIRISVLAAVFLAGGVVAWLTRPNRPLDPASFPIPLSRADVRDGLFVGLLNDARWYALDPEDREAKVENMERVLRSRGLEEQARVVDSQGRLVIRGAKNGDLRPSRFVLLSPDGIKPPPQGEPIDPRDEARSEGD